MNKIQKARIGVMVICITLMIILTYAWNLPWWLSAIMLSPGPLIIIGAIVYKRITRQ
jgi:hypothetical protein